MVREGSPLRCPLCGRTYPPAARFCEHCSVPLAPLPEKRRRSRNERLRAQARKVNPLYTRGPLVAIARANNEAEAEFLRSLLMEFGIPAVLRRAPDLRAPDPLAGGPFELLVASSGAQAARQALNSS